MIKTEVIEEAIKNGDIEWLVNAFDTNNVQFVDNFPSNLSETQIKDLCQGVFDFYKKVGFDKYRHLSSRFEKYEDATHLDMSQQLGSCTVADADYRNGRVRLSKSYLFIRGPRDLAQVVFETIPHEMAHIVHFGIAFARDGESSEECLRLREASWSRPKKAFTRPRFLAHGKVWKKIYESMTGWKIHNRIYKGITVNSEVK